MTMTLEEKIGRMIGVGFAGGGPPGVCATAGGC